MITNIKPDYATINVVLTPELAQRIIHAFGIETDLGGMTPNDLIREVDWAASNEIEIDEAHPDRYTLAYLQQYFETMIENETLEGNDIVETEVRALLNKIWRGHAEGKTKPYLPLEWVDRENPGVGEAVSYGFTHDNKEECAFTISLEEDRYGSRYYELLYPAPGSPSGWGGINNYETPELAKADAEYHR